MAIKLSEVSANDIVLKSRSYSGSGPRYTSYPTAVEFTEEFSASSWEETLRADAAGLMPLKGESEAVATGPRSYALYLHLPFCESLCYFCACNKIITQDRSVIEPYLAALFAEIYWYRDILGSDISVEQIHWGGGSPNYLSPDDMRRVHQETLKAFPNLASGAEVSIEVDPRTMKPGQLEALREVGFNRISMGVQDFDDTVQQAVNRIQSFEMTKKLVEEARSLGFSGVNVDLIYGLPGQTLTGFRDTLTKVHMLSPDRVALYGYAHVTWKQKVQKALERVHLPTPDERIEIFAEAVKSFSEAGYSYIGLDHFARPEDELSIALGEGRLNRNFMGYTTHRGARILGFGVSAISTLPNAFAQNTKDILVYQESWKNRRSSVNRGLLKTCEDCLRGLIIERIMCEGKLDIGEIERNWQIDFRQHFAKALSKIEAMAADGLYRDSGDLIELSEIGRVFSRNIAMAFDEYMEKYAAKKVFSQSV